MRAIILSRLTRPLALALTILLSVTATRAQLVSDGATATINGTATNIASFLSIGNTGPNTTLIVTNGGSVTADNAGIGGTTTSSNNLVAVSGAGSRMTTPGGSSVFRIGNGAAFNRLLISEGGAVTTGYGVVGYPVAASNNSVLVTGSGSAWTNSVLYVGEGAMNNSVTVANGGQVQTSFASTIGVVAGASNNWVTVTGPNSQWSTVNNVLVGDADGQNRLFVNNGGKVTSGANIILGNQSTSISNLLSVAAGTAIATNASGTGTLDVRRGNVEFNDGLIAADQLLLTNAQGRFTFNGGTLITRGATINNGQNFVVGANAGTGPAGATFANTTATTIPGSGSVGPASPYPSVINIANVAGIITKVTVTLSNLSHTFPGDLDVLLVGPDGQKVLLMSDAGDIHDVIGVNLTFADAAAGLLPQFSQITNGTYQPTDYVAEDAFPPTAPPGPYATNLATFNGGSANGAWSLFISDDVVGDLGSLGAWSLNIVTTPDSADLANGALITINDAATATPYPSVINVTNLAGVVSRVMVTVSNFNHSFAGDVNVLLVNPEGAAVALMRYAGSGSTSGATLTFDDAAPSALPFLGSIASGTYRPTSYFDDSLPVPAPAAPYSTELATFNGSNPNGVWSLFVNDVLGDDIGAISNGWSLHLETITPATWDVRSNSAPTTMTGHLVIGENAANARLLITNGAVVANGIGYLGRNPGASNNVALVSGANSAWNNSSVLYVGFSTTGNQLLVSNGGVVANNSGFVGNLASANSNVAVVTGAGSRWTNNNSLQVGNQGSGNQLVVSNGGAVANNNGFLGNFASATNNVAVVTGAGSRWISSSDLHVGDSGSGNQLVVSNGAVVASGSGYLGFNPDANNNVALVTGTGSLWTNSDLFTVGNAGSGNQLVVSDGAVVANVTGFLGYNSGANSNAAIVTGPSSRWNNSGDLHVGLYGAGNQMVVSNGGEAANNNGFLGYNLDANNNVALVTGAGSRWTNSGILRVGNNGSGNQLVVSNGAVVANSSGFLGYNPDASNNLAVVTGAGSRWNNSGELRVGHLGSGNQLTVGDGGVVANSVSILGFDSTVSNNVVLVTGSNSLWTNSSGLNIGYFSGGNQMTVSNGAVVASSYGFLGSGASAGNNVVSVTGPNSRWSNSGDLRVGEFGSRNHLVVSNGGTVSAANVFVGFEISSANRVTVDGGTLRVTNAPGNAVFDIRRGTNVLNAGLIEVDSLLVNNSAGFFTFNGGEFRARIATVANGAVFTVGNGSSAATYHMSGIQSDNHLFNNGLTIANNAVLTGSGTIEGGLTVAAGGTVAPGASIGTIGMNVQPLLQGHVIMEIAKNGATLTKDLISVGDYVIYGGALTVTNLGPTALALGDSFQIFFSFDNNYSGAFTSISLPQLPAGLKWSNQLLANGTIAVVAKTAPQISGLTKTGTNLIYNVTGGSPGAPWYRLTATNVALPLANWTTNGMGVFDWVGNATITNGINFAEPQRYFRISAP